MDMKNGVINNDDDHEREEKEKKKDLFTLKKKKNDRERRDRNNPQTQREHVLPLSQVRSQALQEVKEGKKMKEPFLPKKRSRKKLTLSVDGQLLEDFRCHYKGSISSFLDGAMFTFNTKMYREERK